MKRLPLRFASRADAVRQLRARLESGGWPRLQMMLLVMLTGASGFIASFALLALGVEHMGLRYALACGAAYLCFLGLLWIWIRWRKDTGDAWDAVDGLELADVGPAGRGGGRSFDGGGGSFGGGGASAHFDAPEAMTSAPVPAATPAAAPSGGSTSSIDIDLPDMDAEAIPVLLAVLLLGLLLSSLFVVWSAPVLFAELLLDGVLAAGLYRRLRHIETRHWLETALRKTVWPFVLTAAVLAAAGSGMQVLVPHANSIGDVLAQLQHNGN